MKITLLDINSEMVQAWKEVCGNLPNVEIKQCSFHAFKGDAIVSPANSFGFMDGGIDHKYSEHFGWHVQEQLQRTIRQQFYGELPVGQAVAVDMGHEDVGYLIAAPTMRSPMVLGPQTLNPYLATRAALVVMRELHNELGMIRELSVCFPGMGTGVGRVPFDLCAHQMRQAIEQVVLEQVEYPDSWLEATDTTDDLLRIKRTP
jgi:O-acetyl-ADP-ribose deacetylase (regulator of RNase III)